MIIVYTGRGKGKTSGAIAIAIRSLIEGKKVGFIQFMKSDNTAEAKLKDYFDNLEYHSFGQKGFVDPKNPSKIAINEANRALEKAKELVKEKDVLILDEINVALLFNLIEEQKVIEFLKEYSMPKAQKPTHYTYPIIVCTGIDAPQSVIDIGDLVTEMREVSHPFKKGYLATKGIDY